MARRTIGKPRFYADIPTYLKAIGQLENTYKRLSEYPSGGAEEWEIGGSEIWFLDPTNDVTYTRLDTMEGNAMMGEWRFEMGQGTGTPDRARLLTHIPQSTTTGLYAGALGHSFSNGRWQFNIGLGKILLTFSDPYMAYNFGLNWEEIVNNTGTYPQTNIGDAGFSLMNITGWHFHESYDDEITNIWATISRWHSDEGDDFNLGGVTFGRWFEPEYDFDLQATVSNSYEGISTQTTVGGHTLSNIKHLGQPNWGNGLPAWTIQKLENESYSVSGSRGRRQWEVGFSFLSDDKLFNKAGNYDQFFTYDEDTEQYTFDSSLSSFLKLTLNGKLPFIFCPDNDADEKEFAICRITNQPSFSQVANNLWSTSLVITETW